MGKALTAKEAAEYLGISDCTIRRLLQYGKIDGYKVKGSRKMEWRVELEELDRFYEEGHSRIFCYGCANRESHSRCSVYKDINDPIVGGDGHCISYK